MSDLRNKILGRVRTDYGSVPDNIYAKYIKSGDVTIEDLIEAGMPVSRANSIRDIINSGDNAAYNEAKKTDNPESYKNYIERYPAGVNIDEARQRIETLDNIRWQSVIKNPTKDNISEYKTAFPNGLHTAECDEILSDFPWFRAKQENTIASYQNYKAAFPEKHDAEADSFINALNDENDWNNAVAIGNSDAYRRYLAQHADGEHTDEAKSRIQSNAAKDGIMSNLRSNPNFYQAAEIQRMVANNVVSWNDITNIFGRDKCDAVKAFKQPTSLPMNEPPEELQSNSTEVYFWGTPSSGKTCALGAIISRAQKEGIFAPQNCSGYNYMTRLSNIFNKRGFCTFPDSTSTNNIQEMILKLADKKGRQHKMTLIDLAGELFRSVYFKQNNMFLAEDNEKTLNKALSYLNDKRNNKIHFFVVEYNAHDKEWEGLKMVNYLTSMMIHLEKARIFRKSTVGVYILVTKCDMIDCDPEDRPQHAFDYVSEELPSFYNTLDRTCKQSGVGDFKVLSFSVGDVFAQNLCKFDGRDTDKVINKLLTKTRPEGNGWLEILKK